MTTKTTQMLFVRYFTGCTSETVAFMKADGIKISEGIVHHWFAIDDEFQAMIIRRFGAEDSDERLEAVGIASKIEILKHLTDTMRKTGALDIKDSLKAAEMLGKYYMMFVEKRITENTHKIKAGVAVVSIEDRIKQLNEGENGNTVCELDALFE